MGVKGAVRPVFLALLVPTLLLSPVLTVLYIFMKVSVNLDLSEEKQLSWWSRDTVGVQRIYAEQNPDSVLPALSRAGTYLLIALAIAVGMVRVWPD